MSSPSGKLAVVSTANGCGLQRQSTDKLEIVWSTVWIFVRKLVVLFLRPSSHRTQSTSQQAYTNFGTHYGQWECSHRLQATSKGLHANLHANVLSRPVWTGPDKFLCWTSDTWHFVGHILELGRSDIVPKLDPIVFVKIHKWKFLTHQSRSSQSSSFVFCRLDVFFGTARYLPRDIERIFRVAMPAFCCLSEWAMVVKRSTLLSLASSFFVMAIIVFNRGFLVLVLDMSPCSRKYCTLVVMV